MIELYFITIICTFFGVLTYATFNFGNGLVFLILWSIFRTFGFKSADNIIFGTIVSNIMGMISSVF